MKSFKEYLTESKKVYEFKIKIGGTCPKNCAEKIKSALAQFKVESCSAGKSTPIQEQHSEFPEHRNIEMTVFEVCTSYPATSLQIRSKLAEVLNIANDLVKVKTPADEKEHAINHAHDHKSGEAVLGKDYEASNHQDLVGEKHMMSFLKELSKEERKLGKEVEDANDKLFPKTGKVKTQTLESNKENASHSPVAKRPEDVVKKVF
jgi:hypothetical protein